MVQLLLEHGAGVLASDDSDGMHSGAREIATSKGHTVGQFIAELVEACVVARQGDVELFRARIEAAELTAPLMQWVPVMPAAARAALAIWASESARD